MRFFISTICLLLQLVLPRVWASGQTESKHEMLAYGTLGHNYAEGVYGALGARGAYHYGDELALRCGIECNSSGRLSAMTGWESGMTMGECRLWLVTYCLWRRFPSWRTNEFSSRIGLRLIRNGWSVQMGLAWRTMTQAGVNWLNHSTDFLFEPFNLMYEVCHTWRLGKRKEWAVSARVSDFDDFVMDRAYQPQFSVEGRWKVRQHAELFGRAVVHPTGMFSLSANYYEAMMNIGVNMLW